MADSDRKIHDSQTLVDGNLLAAKAFAAAGVTLMFGVVGILVTSFAKRAVSIVIRFLAFHNEQSAAQKYNTLELPSGVSGPESIAFDCNGDGPYTGISDGRILKWQGSKHGWKEFAITSPFRIPKFCDGSLNPAMEQVCGRPLGLKFNEATCDLYIADAYFGLLVIGQNGGVAKQVAISAEGVPFRFTNALDIDQNTGVVYFTDTSTIFQRWAYAIAMQIGDKTGRLLKYDPRTKEVTVLLRGLSFSNGVALSEDKDFVLVTETTAAKIIFKETFMGNFGLHKIIVEDQK
ncbi:protein STRICTOSIDINE SYNTHASE-LIKE 10-like [Vitis riparia]|uniref:protein STRICTOSIDINE SYNTHASE-LIKE 10-like n=1 Tax=Vitis riparia TaxID=96939 RepID=UPI00155A69DA|nr:protein STRICTOSIDINE SYNTHASE-LIKE 10-like [Vitis riparia]